MIAHPLLTAAVQIAFGLLTGNWLAGGLIMAVFYAGREHAGAEYRWIEEFGNGRRANMPWWGGFDPRAWTKADQVADFMTPGVTVALIYAASTVLAR